MARFVKFPALRCITQTIQRRAIKAGTIHAVIEIGMVRQQGPPLLLNVMFEQVHLTVDGVLLVLLMRGDAGVKGYLHGEPPDVPK